MRFTPLDDNTNSAAFELNNALNVSKVVDEQGREIQTSRSQQDFTVRLSFDQPLAKGKPVTVTFFYDGRLTGQEDSPVYGIKFAAIQNDYAFLMYPARWFPVSGYTTDRFSALMNITVAQGYKVLGSGIETKQPAGDRTKYSSSIRPRLVSRQHRRGEGRSAGRVNSEGVTTTLYFRDTEKAMANVYGRKRARS